MVDVDLTELVSVEDAEHGADVKLHLVFIPCHPCTLLFVSNQRESKKVIFFFFFFFILSGLWCS